MSKRGHTFNISLLDYKNISFLEIIIIIEPEDVCLPSLIVTVIFTLDLFFMLIKPIRNQTRHMNVGQDHDM